MPIDALKAIPVEQTNKPFNRLAFRFAMKATLTNNALSAGSISLLAHRYRKINRTVDGIPILDFCDTDRDDSTGTLTESFGSSAEANNLMQAIARRCRNYAFPGGGSATVSIAMAYYRFAGDLRGTLHCEVTQAGTTVLIASPDTVADSASSTDFDDLVKSIFNAIKNRSDLLGW